MGFTALRSGRVLAVLLACGLAGVPALGQEAGGTFESGTFENWDANADGMIGDVEYRSRFEDAGWFDEWDGDGDDLISADEFENRAGGWGLAGEERFDNWDVNDDHLLDQSEFSGGVFDGWDEDDDNLIAGDEYEAGIDWFE